jgi:predicted nucleic acid-binding protein
LRVASLRSLVADALAVALERDLTIYDASYVTLAEAADAVLVTADRRLGQAAKRTSLLPGDWPP